MTLSEALGWVLVVGLLALVVLVLIVGTLGAVKAFRDNPVKQSFDITPDVLPEKEQDK